MFKRRPKAKKEKKPSFDEWIKRANEALENYVEDKEDQGEKTLKEISEPKEVSKPEIKLDKEGDPLAAKRLRESEARRSELKADRKRKKSLRTKKLRQALIYKEILDKPLSKRSKSKRV